MQYVISDIHGCSKEFGQLLNIIDLKDEDTLYILGDAIDRGPDPVGVLRMMASRYNIVPIVGNHEYMMMKTLPNLMSEVEEDNIDSVLTTDFMYAYQLWMENGGKVTVDQFRALPEDERKDLMDYAMDMSLYEEVSAGGRDYILIHSLPNGWCGGDVPEVTPEEILFGRPDFESLSAQDFDPSAPIFIVGHTPTYFVPGGEEGKIYQAGNLIDIDCGCVAGYNLCAYCLDTGKAYYV